MSKQWVVMFDCAGVDTLIPCDEIKTRDMLEWLGGKDFKSELGRHIHIAKLRAAANVQRKPEIWVYDCVDDLSEDVMREMWGSNPQRMADLVRSKGTCIYRTVKERSVIV